MIIGLVMIDLGFRGTEKQFAQQLGQDFGGGGFWSYLAAIGIVGSIGYYAPLRRVSDIGLALIILGRVFANRNVFSQFGQTLSNPAAPAAAVPLPALQSSSGSGGGGGGGSSDSTLGTIGQIAIVAGAL